MAGAGGPKPGSANMEFKEMKEESTTPPTVEYEHIKAGPGLDPQLYGVLVGVLVGLLTLVLIWWWTSRKRLGRVVLVCGVSDSGKTSVLGQLVAGKALETVTSMIENRHTWSAEGGSSVDLVDVPGSERVRGTLVEKYGPGSRGILFVIDSATITKQIRDVAEFLHSILSLPAVASNSPPLMVLCNKQDVGVAKGESVIKSLLEKEVDKVRVSRGNQLAGLEGANNDSVFIGKEGRPFEFSHLKARVDFCEGSSQDIDTLEPVSKWLSVVA
jgi:signal recognition particle receptor subunit beta